jgi:Ca-activated chloride channel family protein
MACKERLGPPDRQKPARRILVLISDGEDNQSHVTREAAASEALRAGAVIFTIDTDLSGMSYRGLRIMESLAEVTCGESFTQVGRREVPKSSTVSWK